jgi:hypothetical protein
MRRDLRHRVAVIIGFGVLAAAGSALGGDSGPKVRVDVGPLRFQESTTTTVTTETIVGPSGERRIRTEDGADTGENPLSRSADTHSDTDVTGSQNTGVRIERRIYLNGVQQPIVTKPNTPVNSGPGGAIIVGPEVQDGQGSVHTESHQKSSQTPKVSVEVGQ